MDLKQNKGITLADTIIAITIFMIFTALVITISYNIYLQSNFIKRNSTATNYIVDLFEYAQSLNFDDVKIKNLEEYVESKSYKGYEMQISIETPKINDKEIKEGYIKQIEVTVTYKLGNKENSVSMSTLINK